MKGEGMMRTANAAFLCMAVHTLTGCGDDFVTPANRGGAGGADTGGAGGIMSGGAGGGGAGGESFDEFSAACQMRAESGCAAFFACDPIQAIWWRHDEATCVAIEVEKCQQLFGKGTGLTTAAMLACEAALPAEPACDAATPNACQITGPEPNGAPCFSHYECASGRCDGGGYKCGVCEPAFGPGDGGPGEPCPCEAGLGCDVQTQTCYVLGDDGAPCETWFDCSADLACYSGTCGAQGQVGDPCEPAPFGGPDTCRDGFLRCNVLSLVCEPPGAPSPVGGECGYDSSGQFRLCDDGVCAFGIEWMKPGECQPLVPEGGVCEELWSYIGHGGLDCEPGLLCLDEDGDLAIAGPGSASGTCQSTPWRECAP